MQPGNNDLFYGDTIKNLIELLRTQFGSDFKTFYEGDPLVIGQSSLPAMSVSLQDSKNEYGPTQFDKITETIVIKLIVDKRDDFGASDTVDLTERRLRNWIAARDPSTGLYVPESVLGLLRTQITLSSTVIDHQEEVDYGVVRRDKELWTMEAHCKMTVSYYLQIPGRV